MATVTNPPRKRLSPKQLRARVKASRREQARKARSARGRIQRIHRRLPQPIHHLFGPLEPAFTRPTYRRFVLLAAGRHPHHRRPYRR